MTRTARAGRELRALLGLALPIILAQISHTAMGVVDTVMAGRVSAADLAAVALGNSVWMPLYLLMSGILMATTPKVAHRFGARKLHEIGPLVRQALWLALTVGVTAAVLLTQAEPLLRLMEVEESLIEPSMGYLYGVACGFPAVALYLVLRYFSDALGRTMPSMVIGMLGLLLNIPLNYILIHGKLGLPALGGVGCGWATGIVMIAMLAAMLYWVQRAETYRFSELFRHLEWPRWRGIRPLLAVGVPIGVAIFAESSIFSVIALLIGSLGSTVVAGHQIALNISSLVFMVPLSLGMAVTVRVGQALGRNAPHDAYFSALVGIGVALVNAAVSAGAILLFRDQIASFYTPDAAVVALASSLLVYAALYQFSDGVQVCAAGALRGYQDTRAVMLITLVSYWCIGLTVGYTLGLTDRLGQPSGPAGLWQGLILGLSCAAVMLGWRLHVRARRTIQRMIPASG
ncbi:MAG TPA: MATE family efflux transporter [Pseudomonas sp.]|nr:MATE family efflux transporter [Pseudomonas sp.]